MRRIIASEMVSVDGYFAGENGDLSWHNVGPEFNEKYAVPMLNSADLLLFGRITHDMMASYWQSKEALTEDPVVAEKMNSMDKLVFSKTQHESPWSNTTLSPEISAQEILALKQQPGKDILVFGSGTIVKALADLNLIDEYRIIVNPVLLGKGKPLFNGARPCKLKLLKSEQTSSGNVLLCFEPTGT